jgi:hypothetical protein
LGLRAGDVTVCDGIPVTTPVQTLIDVACGLDSAALERAIDEADRLDLVDPEALLGALDSYPARRGVGKLRGLLGGQVSASPTRSWSGASCVSPAAPACRFP